MEANLWVVIYPGLHNSQAGFEKPTQSHASCNPYGSPIFYLVVHIIFFLFKQQKNMAIQISEMVLI